MRASGDSHHHEPNQFQLSRAQIRIQRESREGNICANEREELTKQLETVIKFIDDCRRDKFDDTEKMFFSLDKPRSAVRFARARCRRGGKTSNARGGPSEKS